MAVKIEASRLLPFIELLYLLALGYKQYERASVLEELRSVDVGYWVNLLPDLQNYIDDIEDGNTDFRDDLALALKDLQPQMQANQEYLVDELNIVKAIRIWLLKDSPTQWKSIVNKSPTFSKFASSLFFKDELDDELPATLQAVLDEAGFVSESPLLTTKEKQAFKEQDPALWEDYKAILAEFSLAVRGVRNSFINSKGGICDYQELYEFFTRRGIEYTLPRGFIGKVDTLNQWYTVDGQILEPPTPLVTTYPLIEMNEKFGEEGDWVCKCKPNTGGSTRYIYTREQVKANKQAKFKMVNDLFTTMTRARKKWLSLIKAFDPSSAQHISALVLELLYITAARVGSFRNSNNTYGINTLKVRHVSITPTGSLTLNYLGKDSVKTRYIIKPNTQINKLVIKLVAQLCEGKKPKDDVFTRESGALVTPQDTNRLFKSLTSNPDITVHKIRTFRGTELFKELLDGAAPPKTEAGAIKLWKKLGTEVGKKLNHIRTAKDGSTKATPATALDNYIDPNLQASLFINNGFRLPKKLEAFR